MKIPVYPEDMFSFKDGVEVSNDKINLWISEGISQLEESKDAKQAMTRSGDSMVIVEKFVEEGRTYYEVLVSKGYSQKYIYE